MNSKNSTNSIRLAMHIEGFTSGPVATNSFLMWDDEKNGLIIDAPPESFAEVAEAIEREGITPGALVLTHTHWDHTADVNAFKERFREGLIVYVHPDDEYRLKDPMQYLLWPIPLQMEPFVPDRHLHHGDTLELGAMCFDIIHAPGHSEGSICLYDGRHSLLFGGDVLFAGSVGRTDLPGGDHDTLMHSIREYLLPLPDETRVLPGHGPITTIGEERESNPFIDIEG